jgi:hypothetical protein
MSTISSEREKRQGLINPDLALIFILLIGVSVIFGPFTGDTYNPVGIQSREAGSVSNSDDVSFASDEQYWDANCSHGRLSDSMCVDIVKRARLCATSFTSAYCSDYKEYMQQYFNRRTIYNYY